MSICVVATFKAKDETFEDLKATFKAILPDTAAFEGAELISSAAVEADKSVVVWEIWDKIESQQAYMGWRTERGDVETLMGMLREPPTFERSEHIF